MMRIVGVTLALAVLVLYFIWLGSEMGGATPNGETELGATFGAILLAVLALAAGAFIGRQSR